jgi:hypothetical protein
MRTKEASIITLVTMYWDSPAQKTERLGTIPAQRKRSKKDAASAPISLGAAVTKDSSTTVKLGAKPRVFSNVAALGKLVPASKPNRASSSSSGSSSSSSSSESSSSSSSQSEGQESHELPHREADLEQDQGVWFDEAVDSACSNIGEIAPPPKVAPPLDEDVQACA